MFKEIYLVLLYKFGIVGKLICMWFNFSKNIFKNILVKYFKEFSKYDIETFWNLPKLKILLKLLKIIWIFFSSQETGKISCLENSDSYLD